MTDQLQPNPKPGPFTSPVNVNELNRIIRTLARRIDALETAGAQAGGQAQAGTAATPDASTSQVQDDTLVWVLS